MKALCSICVIMTMGWNHNSLAELLLIPTINRTQVLVFCTRSFQSFLSLTRGIQFLSLAYLDYLLLHISIIRTIFFSFTLHPLQVWTIDTNFLVITEPSLYWKSLITTGLRSCFPNQKPVSAPWNADMHSSIFIMSSGFHNLVTCFHWQAMNGSNCG
jgi:hypothetical protein